MADLISFPFRLAPDGSVVTRVQDSPQYNAEMLGVIVQTEPGERELVPTFGSLSTAFNGRGPVGMQEQADAFGPPVTILRAVAEPTSETTARVTVEFE